MLQVVQTSLFARKKTASCINSSFTVIFLFLFSWGGVNVSVSFLFGLCLCGVDITSEKHAAKWSLYSARFSSPLTDIHLLFLFFWAELKRKGDIDFHQQRVIIEWWEHKSQRHSHCQAKPVWGRWIHLICENRLLTKFRSIDLCYRGII